MYKVEVNLEALGARHPAGWAPSKDIPGPFTSIADAEAGIRLDGHRDLEYRIVNYTILRTYCFVQPAEGKWVKRA